MKITLYLSDRAIQDAHYKICKEWLDNSSNYGTVDNDTLSTRMVGFARGDYAVRNSATLFVREHRDELLDLLRDAVEDELYPADFEPEIQIIERYAAERPAASPNRRRRSKDTDKPSKVRRTAGKTKRKGRKGLSKTRI